MGLYLKVQRNIKRLSFLICKCLFFCLSVSLHVICVNLQGYNVSWSVRFSAGWWGPVVSLSNSSVSECFYTHLGVCCTSISLSCIVISMSAPNWIICRLHVNLMWIQMFIYVSWLALTSNNVGAPDGMSDVWCYICFIFI